MISYQLNDDVIYREVEDKLIAIQTTTGAFYYFSKGSKPFFDFLKRARTWDSIVKRISSDDREYYEDFCETMVSKKVFDKKELISDADNDKVISFEKPIFLNESVKKLEEITSDVVLLTSTTAI